MMQQIAYIDIHTAHKNTGSNFMARECNNALKDLMKESRFQPVNDDHGPYHVDLSMRDNRLIFDIKNAKETTLPALVLSLSPYKRIIKDYFMMIQSYEDLRAAGNKEKLEAVDMGRRGLHNEAAELLISRLETKITMDLNTARRFFTLICALQSQANLWR